MLDPNYEPHLQSIEAIHPEDSDGVCIAIIYEDEYVNSIMVCGLKQPCPIHIHSGGLIPFNENPIDGHWCEIRRREHYEPCRCSCESCHIAVSSTKKDPTCPIVSYET
jgi:hypothetical protein